MSNFKFYTHLLSKSSIVTALVFSLDNDNNIITKGVSGKLFKPSESLWDKNKGTFEGTSRFRIERAKLWDELTESVKVILYKKGYSSVHVSVISKDDYNIVSYISPELGLEIANFCVSMRLVYTNKLFYNVTVTTLYNKEEINVSDDIIIADYIKPYNQLSCLNAYNIHYTKEVNKPNILDFKGKNNNRLNNSRLF